VTRAVPPPVTYADLQGLPWSRHRYHELFDGELITHELSARCAAATRFLWFLSEMSSTGRLTAPWMNGDWYVDEHNAYKPDAVYPDCKIEIGESGKRLRYSLSPPVLAVDILEPPRHDPEPWRLEAYARAGLPTYWVADGEVPSIMIFRLVDGALVQTDVVEGDDVLDVQEPFSLKLCPSEQLT
jgi:hypothetical protein